MFRKSNSFWQLTVFSELTVFRLLSNLSHQVLSAPTWSLPLLANPALSLHWFYFVTNYLGRFATKKGPFTTKASDHSDQMSQRSQVSRVTL